MGGHRRISTELFLANLERAVPRSKVEALLELDLDDWKGTRRSIQAYSRLWGWSRDKVRRLVADYETHLADLANAGETDTRNAAAAQGCGASPTPSTNKTAARASKTDTPTDTPTDTRNAAAARSYASAPTWETTPGPTSGESDSDTFLEQEPEPEEGADPPVRPSALRVGIADARAKQARAQVARALMRAGPEPEEVHAEREARLEVLSETFLAASRIADEAQLRAYFRGTTEIPTPLLRIACDRAFAASERGFAPSVAAIKAEGRKLVAERRRAERGLA